MESSRRVQYLAAFAVSLATMTDGAAFFWITSILPELHDKELIINITSSEISWMVSIMPLGLMIGSMVGGYISDNFGRRVTLLSSALPHFIGTVFVLCATKPWMLYIGRGLWGCGAGMILTVASVYLSEITDKDLRGFLTLMTRVSFSIGMMIVLTIGSQVTYQVLSGILMVFPICYFLGCWWIPESPYYLLKVGKVNAAKKVLLRLGGYKDEQMVEKKLGLMRSDVKKEMARSGSFKELFTGKQYRKAIIVSTGLRATQLLTGVIAIQQYFGRIIQQSNCAIDMSVALITFGVVRFGSGLIAPMMVDRVGRRPLLLFSYLATSVTLAVVGFYFFMQQVIGFKLESTNSLRYIVFIGIILSCTIANMGYNSLVFVIPSEVFPLNVKSTAIAVLNIFTSVISFMVVRGYQIMQDFTGLYGVFWFYAIVSFSGVVFTYFIVPETRGKSLREIQIYLQGNIYDEFDEEASDNSE